MTDFDGRDKVEATCPVCQGKPIDCENCKSTGRVKVTLKEAMRYMVEMLHRLTHGFQSF